MNKRNDTAASDRSNFDPDWASPPGHTIELFLEENNLTQNDLAERMGYSQKHISKLMNGLVPLNETTAIALANVTGITADFWLRLEAHYRKSLIRVKEIARLKPMKYWLKELPYKNMCSLGYIGKRDEVWGRVEQCLKYFAVNNVEAWEKHYKNPIIDLLSCENDKKEIGALTAWLRQGEVQASKIRCAKYDKAKFEQALKHISALTHKQNPRNNMAQIRQLCADAGVALVITSAPKKSKALGLTKWISAKKALIMLRADCIDDEKFWLSFFHQAGHVVLHDKKMVYLEMEDKVSNECRIEAEADAFAANMI